MVNIMVWNTNLNRDLFGDDIWEVGLVDFDFIGKEVKMMNWRREMEG